MIFGLWYCTFLPRLSCVRHVAVAVTRLLQQMCNLQQLFECGQDDLPDALARLPVRETLRPLLVAKISRWKLDPMCMATDLSSAASAAKKKKSVASVTDKVCLVHRVCV